MSVKTKVNVPSVCSMPRAYAAWDGGADGNRSAPRPLLSRWLTWLPSATLQLLPAQHPAVADETGTDDREEDAQQAEDAVHRGRPACAGEGQHDAGGGENGVQDERHDGQHRISLASHEAAGDAADAEHEEADAH